MHHRYSIIIYYNILGNNVLTYIYCAYIDKLLVQYSTLMVVSPKVDKTEMKGLCDTLSQEYGKILKPTKAVFRDMKNTRTNRNPLIPFNLNSK